MFRNCTRAMKTRHYQTDLTDEQCALFGPLLLPQEPTRRPRANLRAVLNAILYLERTGCPTTFLLGHGPHLVSPLAGRRHLGGPLGRLAGRGPLSDRAEGVAMLLGSRQPVADAHQSGGMRSRRKQNKG